MPSINYSSSKDWPFSLFWGCFCCFRSLEMLREPCPQQLGGRLTPPVASGPGIPGGARHPDRCCAPPSTPRPWASLQLSPRDTHCLLESPSPPSPSGLRANVGSSRSPALASTQAPLAHCRPQGDPLITRGDADPPPLSRRERALATWRDVEAGVPGGVRASFPSPVVPSCPERASGVQPGGRRPSGSPAGDPPGSLGPRPASGSLRAALLGDAAGGTFKAVD